MLFVDIYADKLVAVGSLRHWPALQLSGLGDAERVYIQPASAIGGSAPRGIGSVMAQRIVRQAAVALKDLHSMAGHMHLDLKVNNLLVSCGCMEGWMPWLFVYRESG